ncbi:hypothetical protein DFH08DRAFT_963230 [Mycena albidolilacea]|uniref:Uncharacterized protein n=1 Tax=Mycena albidolilacea TaxID=1033008 RepID=A0AAD6ZVM6_9AGAR|nr:hypothetical protein DFH08DRAFT_963230 [Mycena albidolilacea]
MVLDVSEYEEGGCTVLSNQCDGFRKVLHALPCSLLKSLTDFQSPFGWLYHISDPPGKKQIPPGVERAMSYFRLRSVILKTCSGSAHDHFQLERIKWRKECQLSPTLCELYKGNLRQWFTDLMRPTKAEPLDGCWQVFDGDKFCEGDTVQYEIVLNLPIMLIIEIGDIASGNNRDIPKNLQPYLNDSLASAHGVYSSTNGEKTRIFDYDGRQHDGHSILLDGPPRSLLIGPSAMLRGIPEGYFPSMLIYHLDGGEAAQNYFRKHQIERLKKLSLEFNTTGSTSGIPSSCKLVRPDLEKLDDLDRWWLSDFDSETVSISSASSGFPPIEVIEQAPLAPHILEDEVESDSGLIEGKIYMLPEIDDWILGTAWHPAELVVFDPLRDGKEYKFEWIKGIVWVDENPRERIFYRSVAQWEEIVAVERLHEEQIGMVQLPSCFSPVTEGADTASPHLSQLLLLAVPALAHVLAFDTSNPVSKRRVVLWWTEWCLGRASSGAESYISNTK